MNPETWNYRTMESHIYILMNSCFHESINPEMQNYESYGTMDSWNYITMHSWNYRTMDSWNN